MAGSTRRQPRGIQLEVARGSSRLNRARVKRERGAVCYQVNRGEVERTGRLCPVARSLASVGIIILCILTDFENTIFCATDQNRAPPSTAGSPRHSSPSSPPCFGHVRRAVYSFPSMDSFGPVGVTFHPRRVSASSPVSRRVLHAFLPNCICTKGDAFQPAAHEIRG